MTIDILVIPIVGLAGWYLFKHLKRSTSSTGGGCNCDGCGSAKDCPSAGKDMSGKQCDIENRNTK